MSADRESPPRYFRPVCVRTPLGFLGGPSGYMEVVTEDEAREGPVIVEDNDDGEAKQSR